jgi:hypothetical protein
MKTTYRPELIDADSDTLLEAAEALFFDRYEGKIIPVTEGSFAGLSQDFSASTPFNIKVESCDEFDPTHDGYCDLYFYGKPATEADWNHEEIKPMWDTPKPEDAGDMTDAEWLAQEREEILIRVAGISISSEDGEVREYFSTLTRNNTAKKG